MKPNKLSSRLLALALSLVLSLSLSLPALAAGEDGIIYIHTAKDLCAFSDSCAYDAWSRGKTVLLTADISLRGVDFEPIASFSGTFNGGGHTISGLTLTDSLSPAGLFLTLERGAFVHALKVEGQVAPGGTKEAVGGIAGRSYGTIEECSFFGVVKGESAVGGIAGRNEAGGLVANCTVSGSVSANRYTGGIAGYNLGTLRACINSASVNTANVDPTLSLDDLSIDSASSLTDLVSVGAVESRNATSDTGGVAGYSSGSLLSCINRGAVGYPHFGYNVGGGAGRSDGFVDFCSNYGMIYGRKDVGGIVGQMEPYLHLSLRDDLIARLRAELDKLNALVSSTLDDMDGANAALSTRLDSVSSYTNAAVDDADSLAGQTTDFIDKNIGTVNELTDRADDVMDALPDILKALEAAEDSMGDAVDALEQCNKDLTLSAADRAELSAASGRIQTNSAKLKDAADRLNTAVNALKGYLNGSKQWDANAVRRLLSNALAALSDAVSALAEISTDMAKIAAILSDFLKDAAPKAHDDIQRALDALSDAAASLDTATGKTRRLIEDLNARGSLSFYPLGDGYRSTMDSLFANLRGTMDTLDALSDEVSADGTTLTADLRAVNDQMNVVVNLCLDIFVDMTDADASDIFEDTSDENIDAVTFGKVRGCTNYGAVDADLNVGGIAGLSSAGIRSSWAKLTLSGKSSVGGIVGSGSEDTASSAGSGCTVTNCRSLVVVEDCDQFSGAISGRDLGVFRGNYFVSDVLRGIDRRSLSGQAEPMDYAAFCALGSVPEDFLSFTLRFVCDGRTLKTLRFDYGDSFDFSIFPSLTEQSGSYPVWDRTDLTDLRFDTVVTAEYTAYRASLQSDAQRADGRSVFFVEGEFNETDTLTAAAQTPDPNAFPQLADNRRTALKNYFSFLSERTLPAMTVYRSVAEQWELSFPRDALAEHTIRYLPPEEVSMDHCAVFVRRSDGSWQPVETTSMGSYLLFTAEGENVQLAVLTTAAVWWLWAIFLALIAAAVFFIVRVVHRKRGKKAAKPSKKENGAAG